MWQARTWKTQEITESDSSSVVEYMAVGETIGCGEIPEKGGRSYMTDFF